MPRSRKAFSGFPFQNSNTRDPLEDIAARHPDLAEHLQGFPRRLSHRSDPQTDDDFRRHFDIPFLAGRRFDRFPLSRDDFDADAQKYFEVYPEFSPRSPPDSQRQQPNYHQQQPQAHPPSYSYPQYYQQDPSPKNSTQYPSQSPTTPPPQQQQQNQPTLVSQGTQTELPQQSVDSNISQAATVTASELPLKGKQTEANSGEVVKDKSSGPVRGRPIQQSNTVDLGQAQPLEEDLVDVKNQRSMSAPPENKRFTSSINIPVGVQHREDNGNTPSHSQNANSGSTGRIIPIHVEGRDAPVIPKNFGTSSSSSGDASSRASQPQPERIFSDYQRPQTERVFSQRNTADPFRLTNDWHRSRFDQFPEDDFGFFRGESPSRFQNHNKHPKQYHESHSQPSQHNMKDNSTSHNVNEATATAASQRCNSPQAPRQQHESQQEQTPSSNQQQQQQQKQPGQDSVDKIEAIQKDLASLLRQVEQFKGVPRDKNYLYIDEMLTRNLLKLDDVETHGQDSIRSARKEAIKSVERAISLLEAKAAANATALVPCNENMDAEPQQAEASNKMDVATTENIQSEQPKTEKSQSTTSMDVTAASDESTKVEKKEEQPPQQELAVQSQQQETSENSGDSKMAAENFAVKEDSAAPSNVTTINKENEDEKDKSAVEQAVEATEKIDEKTNIQENQSQGVTTIKEADEKKEDSPEFKDSGKKEKKKGKKKVGKEEKPKKE